MGILLVLLAALGGCGGGSKGASSDDDNRPNIVFILTDDLDMRAYRDMTGLAPLLADQGVTFVNNYVSLPLCCPSRTSILRGQYAHNTGILNNKPPSGGFETVLQTGLESSTVATWLQGSGYVTGLIGKYLNGYGKSVDSQTYVPPGWNTWVSPNGGDPYKQFEYSLNIDGKTKSYGDDSNAYGTDVLAHLAVAFIHEHSGKPFFLYLATYAPHWPATPAPRYQGATDGWSIDQGASFDEADVSDKPAWVQALPRIGPVEKQNMADDERTRRASMLAVVDLVQSVVDSLRDNGQLDRTYIFFTSDNGLHRGQHRLPPGKNTAYEEDIHVPLVVRGPGIAAGSSVDALTANVDFAPTFAQLAGAAAPDFVDGRSLVPLLHGQRPAQWRQVVLLEHGSGNYTASEGSGVSEPGDVDGELLEAPPFAGLRTSRRSYVEYDAGERELYDLTVDPDEMDNVYAAATVSRKAALAAKLAALKSAHGQALRDEEATPP